MSISDIDSSNISHKNNNMSKHSFFDLKIKPHLTSRRRSKLLDWFSQMSPLLNCKILMTEEATNANPLSPDTRTLRLISRSAFEVDDYWRIVDILHNKFNWGLAVRKKSERVLKLLEKGPLLKEEREHARKLTKEIKGFGRKTYDSKEGFKENKAPKNDTKKDDVHVWNNDAGEKNSLLDGKDGGVLVEEESHPFNDIDKHSKLSLLAAAEED
ncbi:UPF0759 protein YecE [Bienertia sinuspersici]